MFSSGGQVVTSSHSPAGHVLPPLKHDSDTAVLSDPTPCFFLLGEIHRESAR